MKKIVPLILIVFISTNVTAQNFTGQWKGEFVDKSSAFTGWGGDRCEYVLELECNGTKVTGYSYTYFSDAGKRYYTICKLSGTINKASKAIEVKETERTKTNVPITIRNCFQIHRLTYFQQGDEQSLEGSWVPVPKQEGDCGFGTTVLSRRVLQKNPAYFNNNTTKSTPKKNSPIVKPITPKTQPPVVKNTPKQTNPSPVVKVQPKKIPPPPVAKAEPKKNAVPEKKSGTEPVLPEIKKTDQPVADNPAPKKVNTEKPERKIAETSYEKRNTDLLKTIEIDNPSFTVDLYDNGEIDGDSISLFFNGNLILTQKRLSDKALRLQLEVDKTREVNELIMYAENLGTIPPNTALMVVNDGDNRYEVRISSDLQKSGVIRFLHKPKE
jgi:hypothetical protein